MFNSVKEIKKMRTEQNFFGKHGIEIAKKKTDKFGAKINVPVDDFNHLMDAMRYALEKYITGNKWMY